jgi:hypothetical protein
MARVATDHLNEPLLHVQDDDGAAAAAAADDDDHDHDHDHDDDGAFVDETMQLLIGLLKNLNKELSDSKGTGTPAIHMYSILDQVAALHVCFDQREGGVCQHARLREVDAELIRVLENCNDDKKRKRVSPTCCLQHRATRPADAFPLSSGHCPPNLRLRIPPFSMASSKYNSADQTKSSR